MPFLTWINREEKLDPTIFFVEMAEKYNYSSPDIGPYYDSLYRYIHSGSSYICNPPVLDTDIDYFFVGPTENEFTEDIKKFGFEKTSDPEYEFTGFVSFRSGNYNFILIGDRHAFNDVCLATAIARRQNLLEKDQRVALFEMLRGYSSLFHYRATQDYRREAIRRSYPGRPLVPEEQTEAQPFFGDRSPSAPTTTQNAFTSVVDEVYFQPIRT